MSSQAGGETARGGGGSGSGRLPLARPCLFASTARSGAASAAVVSAAGAESELRALLPRLRAALDQGDSRRTTELLVELRFVLQAVDAGALRAQVQDSGVINMLLDAAGQLTATSEEAAEAALSALNSAAWHAPRGVLDAGAVRRLLPLLGPSHDGVFLSAVNVLGLLAFEGADARAVCCAPGTLSRLAALINSNDPVLACDAAHVLSAAALIASHGTPPRDAAHAAAVAAAVAISARLRRSGAELTQQELVSLVAALSSLMMYAPAAAAAAGAAGALRSLAPLLASPHYDLSLAAAGALRLIVQSWCMTEDMYNPQTCAQLYAIEGLVPTLVSLIKASPLPGGTAAAPAGDAPAADAPASGSRDLRPWSAAYVLAAAGHDAPARRHITRSLLRAGALPALAALATAPAVERVGDALQALSNLMQDRELTAAAAAVPGLLPALIATAARGGSSGSSGNGSGGGSGSGSGGDSSGNGGGGGSGSVDESLHVHMALTALYHVADTGAAPARALLAAEGLFPALVANMRSDDRAAAESAVCMAERLMAYFGRGAAAPLLEAGGADALVPLLGTPEAHKLCKAATCALGHLAKAPGGLDAIKAAAARAPPAAAALALAAIGADEAAPVDAGARPQAAAQQQRQQQRLARAAGERQAEEQQQRDTQQEQDEHSVQQAAVQQQEGQPAAEQQAAEGQPPAAAAVTEPRCEECGATDTAERPLRKCRGCRRALFCSADCQKAAWQGHKAACAAAAAERTAAGSAAAAGEGGSRA